MPATSRGTKVFKNSTVRNAFTVRGIPSTVAGTSEATALLGVGAIAVIKAACTNCGREMDVPIGSHVNFPTHFSCPDCGSVMESL